MESKEIRLYDGEIARFVLNAKWEIAQLQRRDCAGFWAWDGWTIPQEEYEALGLVV